MRSFLFRVLFNREYTELLTLSERNKLLESFYLKHKNCSRIFRELESSRQSLQNRLTNALKVIDAYKATEARLTSLIDSQDT